MDAATMKAAVDTRLDEVTAATGTFVTTTEVYAALAQGQVAVIGILLSIYKAKRKIDPFVMLPYELESLLNDDVGTVITDPSVIAVPTGFLDLIAATYDHDASGIEKPCFIVDLPMIGFSEDNTFQVADGDNPRVYIKSISDTLKLVFLPTKTAVAPYTIHYIKKPTDIASGQDATLPSTTHTAIVEFATAILFQKDNRAQEAQVYYQKYLSELRSLG
jgi:hypothetical protein